MEGYIVALLTGSAVAALISGISNIVFYRIKRKDDSDDAFRKGMRFLLADKLKYLAGRHIEKKSITYEDYQIYDEAYQAYHALGGNGPITRLHDEIAKLPITKAP